MSRKIAVDYDDTAFGTFDKGVREKDAGNSVSFLILHVRSISVYFLPH